MLYTVSTYCHAIGILARHEPEIARAMEFLPNAIEKKLPFLTRRQQFAIDAIAASVGLIGSGDLNSAASFGIKVASECSDIEPGFLATDFNRDIHAAVYNALANIKYADAEAGK